MIRVLMVDDHEVVRSGIKAILTEMSVPTEAGEASSVQEALRQVREHEWDVVILDISLAGRSGLDFIGELRALRPRLPVLILSAHSELQYALRALKSGAAGYVTKGSPKEDLIEAINRVRGGKKYVSPVIAEKMAEYLSDEPEKAPHEKLSPREYEIMRLIAAGRKPADIAEVLSISVKTVSTHRARILTKMDMKTDAELIKYAVRHDLIG